MEKPADSVPQQPIPVHALTREALISAPDDSLFRLGHSTLLFKLNGDFWLTDPVFSERASPFNWIGPKRFHQPPISIQELPSIKCVVLSHDHYDHLDYAAVMELANKVEMFITPLGVGDRLIKWGISPQKIRQLNWWDETSLHGVKLAAVPAQHFSGRGVSDSNQTLWVSWVIMTDALKLFFSGDTGYHADFKTIGDRYGPFDLTLMETGAYDVNWSDIHMQPEETLKAHLDLQGRWLIPIHNGTFDLAMHSWSEPFERIYALAKASHVLIGTPMMGERLSLVKPTEGTVWWRHHQDKM